jgi:capsular polysaccharide transport system permease protein
MRRLAANAHWLLALAAIALVTAYWFLWAHDRYVSRAVVVLQSPQIASPNLDFSGLFGAGGGNRDLLLLREHLLSVDMLRQVERTLPFREHYSTQGDRLARLGDPDAPIEELHDYYHRWVEVELDDYAGVLNIQVQAFTPQFALELNELLLAAGEAHMNEMGRRLAAEQVQFLEEQVRRLGERLEAARGRLLEYQNRHGLVSPTQTVESLNQVVATLEGELARLQAQRRALASFQSERSAEMVRVQSEIEALREQIATQRDRLAQAAGESLNRISADYQMLELQAEFARETYAKALSALENTRIEAARKLKAVSVLQSPPLPEYPVEPRAAYYSAVFAIVTLFVALIVHMLVLIIRDHVD